MIATSERLAFDTRAYINSLPHAIAAELAAVTIENSHGTSLREGIHSGRLALTKDRQIVDARTSIPPKYSRTNEFDNREANSGDRFDEVLLNHPEGSLVFWISPDKGPLNYQEGRVRVGIKKGETDLFFYGIRIRGEINYEGFRNFGAKLSEFAKGDFDLSNTESLRDQVFVISPENIQDSPWKFLENVEPNLKDAWKAIEETWVDQHFEKILQETMQIAPTLYTQLKTARTRADFVRIGTQGEKFMMERGYRLRGSGCGKLNSEIQGYSRTNFTVAGGQIASIGTENMKFVKHCGQCGRPIYKFIGKGYECKCGGKYQGC